MNLRFAAFPLLLLLPFPSLAGENAKGGGTLRSSAPVVLDGAVMSPIAAPVWPVTDGDELEVTSEPALLTTIDGNSVAFEPKSKARLSTVDDGQAYIYLRQGEVRFETAVHHVYICAGNRLFVPPTPAKGVLTLGKADGVTRRLVKGRFLVDGSRECGENGIAGLLPALQSALAGAAGASTAGVAGGTAAASAAGAAAGGLSTGAITAIAAGAVGAGTATAVGLASSGSACSTPGGCNFNAVPVSPSQP